MKRWQCFKIRFQGRQEYCIVIIMSRDARSQGISSISIDLFLSYLLRQVDLCKLEMARVIYPNARGPE